MCLDFGRVAYPPMASTHNDQKPRKRLFSGSKDNPPGPATSYLLSHEKDILTTFAPPVQGKNDLQGSAVAGPKKVFGRIFRNATDWSSPTDDYLGPTMNPKDHLPEDRPLYGERSGADDQAGPLNIPSTTSDDDDFKPGSDMGVDELPPNDVDLKLPPERTLGNVLSRVSMIKGLHSRRKQGSVSAAEQRKALRQYWMPDSNSKDCYDCGKAFHTFRRRHHCRVCGQIFCWQCCTEVISGELLGLQSTRMLRCCNYCKEVIRQSEEDLDVSRVETVSTPEREPRISHASIDERSSLSSPDLERGGAKKRGTLMPRAQSTWNISKRASNFNLAEAVLNDVVQSLACAVVDGSLKVSAHRDRLVTYAESFVASDFVDWILSTKKHCTERSQAVEIGQILLDRRFIVHVRGDELIFIDDYVLYKTTPATTSAATHSIPLTSPEEDPAWFEEISYATRETPPLDVAGNRNSPPSNTALERFPTSPIRPSAVPLEIEDSGDSESPVIIKPKPRLSVAIKSRASRGVLQTSSVLRSALDDDRDFQNSTLVGQAHLHKFMEQLLVKSNLPMKWMPVLMKLLNTIVANVRPNVQGGDDVDIRQYVQVNCVTGGSPEDSRYIHGAILAKKIAHKKMPSDIKNPRILIMQIALEYQRVENKYSSLETVLLQEQGYLQNIVAKIVDLKPNVVIVSRSVARLAQKFLMEAGITVVLNIHPTAMEYVARCTNGEVLKSINSLGFVSRLGTCELFKMRRYETADGVPQWYVCFEGCNPELGCTILLRGGSSRQELQRVRQVLLMGAYIANSIRLETHFLHNEQAVDIFAGRPAAPLLNLDNQDGFQQLIRDTILNTSPGVMTPLPYLYTSAGLETPVKRLLPANSLWFSRDTGKGSRLNGMDIVNNRQLDCFRAENHQSIDVLFMCMDSNLYPCDPPRVIQISFYGTNDVSLGNFIENYCLRPSYKCPNAQCEDSMESHIRSFVHYNGRVTISMERLKRHGPSQLNHGRMCMWSWCKRCERSTAVVSMSDETWSLSLGKFLESTFYGDGYRVQHSDCNHSLHKDHIRYFNQGDDVVYFDYEPIEVSELVPPRVQLSINPLHSTKSEWEDQAATCEKEVKQVSTEIKQQLRTIEVDAKNFDPHNKLLLGFELRRKQDELRLMAMVEHFRSMLADVVSTLLSSIPRTDKNGEPVDFDIENIQLGEVVTRTLEANLFKLQLEISRTVHHWNHTVPQQSLRQEKQKGHHRTHSGSELSLPRTNSETGIATISENANGTSVAGNQEDPATINSAISLLEDDYLSDPTSRVVSTTTSIGDDSGLSPSEDNIVQRNKSIGQTSIAKGWKNLKDVILSQNSIWQPLTPAFSPTVHFCEQPSHGLGIPIYEDEPSSIIAYLLAHDSYRTFVHEGTGDSSSHASLASHHPSVEAVQRPGEENYRESTKPDKVFSNLPNAESSAPPDVSGVHDADPEVGETDRDNTSPHYKHQWSEGHTKFYCQIYFAREFKELRSMLAGTEDAHRSEDDYIRSLSRCVKWDPHGGKSKAHFSKMLDDRYILKQMSRPEAQSSIDFIPHYISYITEAYQENKPTVFAKILGIYRIGYQNSHNRRAVKQDVLVMENLFYKHTIPRIFDLKGSLRSRYVTSTGKEGDVLLDENLVEFMCSSPLYLRDHCKYVLRHSIQNDTTFLAAHGVMDYSLLLGIDEERGQLVVGIIDYIRTFTWDKRLEMYVKRTGLLGGHGNLPTVISPKMYKQRFSEAMDRYFFQVPEKWSHLANFEQRQVVSNDHSTTSKAGNDEQKKEEVL